MVQFAKDTRKRKKYFQTKPRTETAQQWVPKSRTLFPQKLCNCSRLIKSVYHVLSVFVFITTSNGNATGKAQETPRQRDIVYFDRQRPHQNPDYSKAKDQDLCTARYIAKSLRLKEAGYLFLSVLILSFFYNQ